MNDDPIVSTEVVEESGRFVVVLSALLADGVVRHRLGEYHTRAKAEHAARLVKATADRQPGPNWGL